MTALIPTQHTTVPSVITVTSPLVHSDEHVETMQRFRREPYYLAGETLDIPVYSGNAIRGMLRRMMALRVCDAVGITDRSLPTDSFYLLFTGGKLEGSDYAYRVDEIQRIRGLLPHLGLMGCSWGARILHGHLDVWRGEPVCLELADTLGHVGHQAYESLGGDPPSVFDLIGEVAYTRRDDITDRLMDGESSPVQMRYQFECLIPGTLLLHGAVVRTRDPLMRGAFADAVLMATSRQSLGGRSAIGHGRFAWTWSDTMSEGEWAEHRDAYLAHLAAHADEIREFLDVQDA